MFFFTGLFHKAILQSGVANNPWASVPHSPKKNAIKIASILGKESSDPVEIVEFLRTIDVVKLLEAQMGMLKFIVRQLIEIIIILINLKKITYFIRIKYYL